MQSYEDFHELVMARRSIRGYKKDQDVPDEMIRKILDAARWAPSGGNGQPWEFIVVRNEETRHQIADIFIKQQVSKIEMEKAARGEAKMTGAGFKNAPVHIVVVGDPRVNLTYPIRTMEEKSESHFYTGMANTCLLIMLAARSMGLSTQYVSDASSPYMSTMLKVLLGIPDDLRVYHLIPVGYASGDVAPRPRRELEEIVHFESYDPKKYRDDAEFRKFVMTASRRGSYGKRQWVEDDVQQRE